jgi:hypothetical protein
MRVANGGQSGLACGSERSACTCGIAAGGPLPIAAATRHSSQAAFASVGFSFCSAAIDRRCCSTCTALAHCANGRHRAQASTHAQRRVASNRRMEASSTARILRPARRQLSQPRRPKYHMGAAALRIISTTTYG